MCEKDVRFQEQVQKHEEELLRVTTQSQLDGELQQVQDSATLKTIEVLVTVNNRATQNPKRSVSMSTFNWVRVLSSAKGPGSSTEAL